MSSPGGALTEADRGRINAAVAAAEAKTEAEIVPVVAAASGRYDRAEDLVGVWAGLIAQALLWAFWEVQPERPGTWGGRWHGWELIALLATFLVAFVVGTALASWFWGLRKPFVTRREMDEEVAARARQVFSDRRVHRTAGGTGLLVYVSLFERHAAVYADQAVLEKLGQPALKDLCDGLTAALQTGSLADALCGTIGAAGEKLAVALPRVGEAKNELPDAVVVLG